MANTPDLIMIDRAKLNELLMPLFPNAPKVRENLIEDLKPTPVVRGVTPNRKARGETIVLTAIRLAKKLNMGYEELLPLLIQTTDVWEERAKLRRELIGQMGQVKKFLSERVEDAEDMEGTKFSEEQLKTMGHTLLQLTWRLQDLEEAERKEAEGA